MLAVLKERCDDEGMADPHVPIAHLSDDECWALLVSNSFGRLVVTIGGRAEIFPVNYHAGEGSILFRTAEGTKLFGLTVNRDVVFEIDDHDGATGWSVVARGEARVLTTTEELSEAQAAPLEPWTATVKRNFVRIHVTEVSGRRASFGPEPDTALIDF